MNILILVETAVLLTNIIFMVFTCSCLKILSTSESVQYCPNSQLPEFDNSGSVKQCLPGRKGICAPGYSCYFSGTNYQCCPAEEELNSDNILECPSTSITVLTDAGLPITCVPTVNDCPQSTMQCTNVGKHSICCERLPSLSERFDDVPPMTGLSFLDGTNSPVELNNEFFDASNLECPEPAFTILDGNGDPLSCNEEDCTHQTGRFCYKILNTPICCEGEERAVGDNELLTKFLRENKHSNEKQAQWNSFKYSPLTSTQKQLQKKPLSSNNRLRYISNIKDQSSVFNSVNFEVISLILSTSEIYSCIFNFPISTTPSTTTTETTRLTKVATTSTASTVTTKKTQQSLLSVESQEIPVETIRYKPHSAGGYSISRALSTKTHQLPENLKAFARDYLLEHIRRGWPYSEEFYRTYGNAEIDNSFLLLIYQSKIKFYSYVTFAVPFNSRSQQPGAEVKREASYENNIRIFLLRKITKYV
ncbi:unnamed protein product [Thelazia callipaeda]|uniref:Uncharacterized protein n=1 Tax=Thelazia callipaeda TaxID=103827 RepID=A0A158RAU0_THECL|nr:unnamed protein product [Thelazia callipaeda]